MEVSRLTNVLRRCPHSRKLVERRFKEKRGDLKRWNKFDHKKMCDVLTAAEDVLDGLKETHAIRQERDTLQAIRRELENEVYS